MRKLVEAVLENLSSKDVFLYQVACACCGAEFGNKPMRFSKAGIPPTSQSKRLFFDALYEQEAKTAQLSAISNAAEHLNHCPVCKRLVCNRCFLICEELDMCSQCAVKLGQRGSPVQPSIIEAAV